VTIIGQVPHLLGISGTSGNFFTKLWFVLDHLSDAAPAPVLTGPGHRPIGWNRRAICNCAPALTIAARRNPPRLAGYAPPIIPRGEPRALLGGAIRPTRRHASVRPICAHRAADRAGGARRW